MNWGKIHVSNLLPLIAALTLVAISALAANTPHLSGSYRVLHQDETGGQARVRVQIHLVNPLAHDLRIQRITVWDLAHPAKGASQACSLIVHTGSSLDTTQEFTIPHAEYDLWLRGAHPRIVLEILTPNGRPANEVVRLNRENEGKEN